jgi:hypothetical protein
MNLNLTEKNDFDTSKFKRVLHLHEVNRHPHNFELDYDIFFAHSDQPLSLLQPQSEDGNNFMAYSSRLALLSQGKHSFNAHRKR